MGPRWREPADPTRRREPAPGGESFHRVEGDVWRAGSRHAPVDRPASTIGRCPIADNALETTRQTLHAIAEHLLAGDLARRTARIGLRATPGGFGQPEHLADGHRRRLRIDGSRLVMLDGDTERWHELTTAAEAAAFAGAALGPPGQSYAPETVLAPDQELLIDPEAAARLAGWFDLVNRSLEEVRRNHADAEPSIAQVWPEHFVIACTIDEVNLGGSPGDADHPQPYLYVGPWTPRVGDFWNEPWGASLDWAEVPDVASAVSFLEDGLQRAWRDR